MDGITANPDFNPYTQTFTLLLADGVTPFNVSIAELDEFNDYNVQAAIMWGSQIGASLLMLVVVALMTKSNKRRSFLFAVNIFSLIVSFLRALLNVLYYVEEFCESYIYFSGDYTDVPSSAYSISVAATVFNLLLLLPILISLLIQTHVVCATMSNVQRSAVMTTSGLIAAATAAMRFVITVYGSQSIMGLTTTNHLYDLNNASHILETAAIWYFCCIFLAKLGWTLYMRKMMGMKQWGPMQIICIMGGCTMIIPSISAILQYFPFLFPEAGSLDLTMVAIFLPLSSIWASVSASSDNPLSPSNRSGSGSHPSSYGQGSRFASLPGANVTKSEFSPTYKSDFLMRSHNRDNSDSSNSAKRPDSEITMVPSHGNSATVSTEISGGNGNANGGNGSGMHKAGRIRDMDGVLMGRSYEVKIGVAANRLNQY